jgi:hypothetical protein
MGVADYDAYYALTLIRLIRGFVSAIRGRLFIRA